MFILPSNFKRQNNALVQILDSNPTRQKIKPTHFKIMNQKTVNQPKNLFFPSHLFILPSSLVPILYKRSKILAKL